MSVVVEKWLETYFPDYLERFVAESDIYEKVRLESTKDDMLGKLKKMSKTEINEWGNSEYNSQVEGAASKLALQDLNNNSDGRKIVKNFQGFMTDGMQIKSLTGDKLEQQKKKTIEKLIAKAEKTSGKPLSEEAKRKIKEDVDNAAKKNAEKLGKLSVDKGITFDEMLSNRGTIVAALDARLGDNFTEAYLDPSEMCDEDIRDQRNDIKEQLFLTKKGGDRDLGRGRTTWDDATSESAFVGYLTGIKNEYVGGLNGAEYDKSVFLQLAAITDHDLWKLANVSEEVGGKKVKREKIDDFSNKDSAAFRLKNLKNQYKTLTEKVGKNVDAEVISTLELMSVTTEGGDKHNEELYGKQFGLSKNLLGDPTEYFVKSVRHGKNANVRIPGSLASEIFETLAVPMVGGVSGTTVDFIAVLKDRAKKGKPAMNEKEIEAVAAAFMFSMVGAGHHSLVEMIAGAQQWGYFFDVPNPLTILAQGKTAFDAMRNDGGKVVEDGSFLDKGNTVTLPSYEACLKGFEQYVKGLGIDTSGLLAQALSEEDGAENKKFDIKNQEFAKNDYQKFSDKIHSVRITVDYGLNKQGAKSPELAHSTLNSAQKDLEKVVGQLDGVAEEHKKEFSDRLAEQGERIRKGHQQIDDAVLDGVKKKMLAWGEKLGQLARPEPYPTDPEPVKARAKFLNENVFEMEVAIKNTLGFLERLGIGASFVERLKGALVNLAEGQKELAELAPTRSTKGQPQQVSVTDPPKPTITPEQYDNALKIYTDNDKNWFNIKHKYQEGVIDEATMKQAWAYRDQVVFGEYMPEHVDGRFENYGKKNGWDAAGSTNLESDIDITIFKHGIDKKTGKKVYDYQIVKEFNDYFMKRFGAQPGIMFDTNLYASAAPDVKEKGVVQSASEKKVAGKMKAGQDMGALMKVRRYMSWDEFEDYRAEIIKEMKASAGKGEDIDLQIELTNMQFDEADANFQLAQRAILDKAKKMLEEMKSKGELNTQQVDALNLVEKALGLQKNETAESQQILLDAIKKLETLQDVTMMVNNEIYTERIEAVRKLEEQAKALGDKIEKEGLGEGSPEAKKLEEIVADLSRFKAEAVLFANEAYHSQGPFKHVVMATQAVGGDVEKKWEEENKPKKFKEALTPEEQGKLIGDERNKRRDELGIDLCLQSFNEQMGDFLKDLKHYSSEPFPGQGFYRSSKYLSRLFDALILLEAKMADKSPLKTGLGDLKAVKKRIDDGMLASRAGKLEFKSGDNKLTGSSLQHEIEAFAVDEIKDMFKVTNLQALGGVFKTVTSKVNAQVRKVMAAEMS